MGTRKHDWRSFDDNPKYIKNQIEKSSVIALHCSPGTGRQWAKLAQELDTRFRVLAPDISGYGNDRGSTDLATTLADEVAYLGESLQGKRDERSLIIQWCMAKGRALPRQSYSLLRAIRPRGRSRHLAVLAQPVQGLMPTEAAQFEMADFKDRCRNFGGKSTCHEQWPANVLAEEFQPAEDVDVAPDGGEVETIARANIPVCGIAIVQSNIDGNMLLDLGQ